MKLQTKWSNCDIFLHEGDITRLEVDAIINPANAGLFGGGGLDAVIHRAGGSAIMQECKKIMADREPLATGEAVITTGGELPSRFVIHVLGPRYRLERIDATRLLALAYRNALQCAQNHGLRSVAFPCISTGSFFYPSEEACPVALCAVREELENNTGFEKVIFCTYNSKDCEIYRKAFSELRGGKPQRFPLRC